MLFDANDIATTQAFLAAAAAAAAEQGHEDFTLPGHLPASLSEYYMPLLAGMQDILRSDLKLSNTHQSTQPQTQYPTHSLPSVPKEDEDHNEYVDHLEQPGNTKKRKVPLVRQTNYPGYPADFIGEVEIPEGDLPNIDRRMSPSVHEMEQNPRPPDKNTQQTTVMPARKIHLSRATRAWLSNKEMLKARKRQLTAVLGAMYNGDSPALDQALSSVQPFAKGMSGSQKEGARVRFSRRQPRVTARRALGATKKRSRAPGSALDREFTFSVLCATSERLVTMREEVTTLHAKFEEEWAAQSARNAEAAKRAARKVANTPGSKSADAISNSKSKGGSKKKRRSALANASNPHHLRNYVPSRLPNSGPPPSVSGAAIHQQNLISPLALRFLSAQLPPKRRGPAPAGNAAATSQLTTPGDEWICAFCEYDLFYGDEARFHRAVRNRKKILKRRRRAREKAAATASGTKAAGAGTVSSQGEEEGGADDDESRSDGGDGRGEGRERERERAPG